MIDFSGIKQKLPYFILAGVLMLAMLGGSFFTLGLFGQEEKSAEAEEASEQRYRHISMSEAHTACERRARETFGERLYLLTLDKLSSRLDRKDQLYKLFFTAELYETPERQGPPQLYYINCFTGTQSPQIANFEYSPDGQDFVKPGEESKGLFGL